MPQCHAPTWDKEEDIPIEKVEDKGIVYQKIRVVGNIEFIEA